MLHHSDFDFLYKLLHHLWCQPVSHLTILVPPLWIFRCEVLELFHLLTMVFFSVDSFLHFIVPFFLFCFPHLSFSLFLALMRADPAIARLGYRLSKWINKYKYAFFFKNKSATYACHCRRIAMFYLVVVIFIGEGPFN